MEEKKTLKEILSIDDEKERNKRICEKYPWLIPNDWFGTPVNSSPERAEKWDYSFTWLDDFPEGWFEAFGEEMIEEIDKEIRTGKLVDFGIDQIKEKYGELRFYCHGFNESLMEIVDDYSVLSRGICISCGKPDVRITTGWITPICFDCWTKFGYAKGSDASEMHDMYIKQTEDSPMPSERKWRSFNNKSWKSHTRDISQKANQIRAKYRQKVEDD